eukprot:3537580-Amphidinium_carterae.1
MDASLAIRPRGVCKDLCKVAPPQSQFRQTTEQLGSSSSRLQRMGRSVSSCLGWKRGRGSEKHGTPTS